jgi:hypothetical protein
MKQPEAPVKQLMELMKGEIAKELGIRLPADGYWGTITAKDCGKIGSLLRKRTRDLQHRSH